MLCCEQGRGHQDGDLLAGLNRDERRAQRHFGLAEATSPQITRSMGLSDFRSLSTCSMARLDPAVSSKRKSCLKGPIFTLADTILAPCRAARRE